MLPLFILKIVTAFEYLVEIEKKHFVSSHMALLYKHGHTDLTRILKGSPTMLVSTLAPNPNAELMGVSSDGGDTATSCTPQIYWLLKFALLGFY